MEELNSRKKGVLTRLLTALATVLIVFSTAVACVQGIAFDSSFYKQEYTRFETAAYVGVGTAELEEATDVLLDYLQDRREDLDMPVLMQDGTEEEYYTAREKAHMVDVKALYQNALAFMVIGFTAGGALLALMLFAKPFRDVRRVCQTYFWTTIGILGFFAVIGIWAAADFGTFWVNFHYVFFTNDLWMLDPAVSRMIRMFEQDFFADMVGRILTWFLALTCGAGAAMGIVNRRIKRKNEGH
ncbi:MAG: TIGR01906 family membrane protein [Christensenella sp.]|nr:TIGR01906 family membrane protein [Christensenella sp.]